MQQDHRYYNIENTLLDPSPALPILATSHPAAANHFTTPLPFSNVKTILYMPTTNPSKLPKAYLFSSVNTVIDKGASTSPHLNFNFIQISQYIVRLVVTLNAQFIIFLTTAEFPVIIWSKAEIYLTWMTWHHSTFMILFPLMVTFL